MIVMNKSMKGLALGEMTCVTDYPLLPADLKKIVDEGFIKKNECYFFKRFMSDGANLSAALVRHRFGDFVGYEISKNTVHIDDFANDRSLSVGLAFCWEFSKRWGLWSKVPCKVVLASKEGEFGEDTTFRFYVPRVGEEYMDFERMDDLDEAIMVVDVLPGGDTDSLRLKKILSLASSQ